MKSVGVIGGGAWGTALAQAQACAGRDVIVWAREVEVVQAIRTHRENTPFLKGSLLHESLKATSDLAEVAACDALLLVTPAQYLRASLRDLKPYIHPDQPLVICSKGIEIETGSLLLPIAQDIMGAAHPLAILTGPTFAREVAEGLPVAVTIASEDDALLGRLQTGLGHKNFRPYVTQDVIGTQLGGALKNVVAIAAGVATGRGLGESARCALITRGLSEIANLCAAMGGQRDTLLGMCGVGDLMLTCSSMQSRNCSLGVEIGRGKAIDDILSARRSVTEGVHTARAALRLAETYAVDMPICTFVNALVTGRLTVDAAIEGLLSRPFAI